MPDSRGNSGDVVMIILASGSPRRKSLLESLGVSFTVYSPDVDENMLPGETPSDLCARLSVMKAEAGLREYPSGTIIAADTMVVIGDEVLGKPANRTEAARMLRELSGKVHEVITGLTVIHDGNTLTSTVHTFVKFRELSDDEISAYIKTGEPDDKAGGYAVQGKGSLLIERINGDYYNVVGLPLFRLGEMLASVGISFL